MASKQDLKLNLQKKLGLEENSKLPLLLINISENKEEQALIPLLQGLTALSLQTVITPLPTHPEVIAYRDKYPAKIKMTELAYDEILQACDLVYFTDQEPAQEEIAKVFQNKTVPIIKTGLYSTVHDFDPIKEKGNSFTFSDQTPWHIFAAIVRAVENYKFPYDWKNIVREGSSAVRQGKNGL